MLYFSFSNYVKSNQFLFLVIIIITIADLLLCLTVCMICDTFINQIYIYIYIYTIRALKMQACTKISSLDLNRTNPIVL
jgi:hypothetical protein